MGVGREGQGRGVEPRELSFSGAVADIYGSQVLKVEPEGSPYKSVEAQTAQNSTLIMVRVAQQSVMEDLICRPLMPRRFWSVPELNAEQRAG